MAANKYTKALIANHIQDGLLRDHVLRELWLCVPDDIDDAIDLREKQILVLGAIKVDLEAETGEVGQ